MAEVKCPLCWGSGYRHRVTGSAVLYRKCKNCNGKGWLFLEAQTSWERGMERIRHGEEVWRRARSLGDVYARDGADLRDEISTIWASLSGKATRADHLMYHDCARHLRSTREGLISALRALPQRYPIKKPREGREDG